MLNLKPSRPLLSLKLPPRNPTVSSTIKSVLLPGQSILKGDKLANDYSLLGITNSMEIGKPVIITYSRHKAVAPKVRQPVEQVVPFTTTTIDKDSKIQ